MRFVGWFRRAAWLALLLALLAAAWMAIRPRPADLPWTPLDLSAPIGLATGRKLTALGQTPARCRALLAAAGVSDVPAPAVAGSGLCGYRDGMRLVAGAARTIAWRPAGVAPACAIAASLAVWEWNVVQPAAIARYGVPVVGIDHFGAFSCRRIAGRAAWSEHATADAIDVAGFRLADGRRVTVARDWRGAGRDPAFLRDVRDGACRLFATVLSPDFNAAHRDHLHLDQAARGTLGWRACR